MKLKFKKRYVVSRTYDLNKYNLERKLIVNYGLRNKKEVGKYNFLIKKYRNIYKLNNDNLISKKIYEQVLYKLKKQNVLGQDKTILDITVSDFMERRLQTIVYKNKIARTLMHARQLIVHKKIKVNDVICIRPSRIINMSDNITYKN